MPYKVHIVFTVFAKQFHRKVKEKKMCIFKSYIPSKT